MNKISIIKGFLLIFLSIFICFKAIAYDSIEGYILSDSNSRMISEQELMNLTPWELKVARNEIYARHGRKFVSADLRCYFQNKIWYSISPNYSDKILNGFEINNATKILNYEKKIGSKATYKDAGCNYGKEMATSNSNSNYNNDYVYLIYDSNSRNLTEDDLINLTHWQLKAARNEIYARHGRKFVSADLRCYFQNKPWYNVNTNYSDKLLNNFEQNNALKILNYEKKVGSKYTLKDMGCEFGRNQ